MPSDPDTRTAILDAAEVLFARQGFAATTIKQIGAAAAVNSALLYYYFDDKETLYRATLRRLLDALVGEGMRRLDAEHAPAAAIRRLVEGQVEFLIAHPTMPRLMARELVEHQAAHAAPEITHTVAGLFRRLCDLIRQGQRDGSFRAGVSPEYAAISTIAQVVYLFIARPAVGLLLGHGTAGPPDETMRAFGRHAADFAIAALTDPAPRGAGVRRPPRAAGAPARRKRS